MVINGKPHLGRFSQDVQVAIQTLIATTRQVLTQQRKQVLQLLGQKHERLSGNYSLTYAVQVVLTVLHCSYGREDRLGHVVLALVKQIGADVFDDGLDGGVRHGGAGCLLRLLLGKVHVDVVEVGEEEVHEVGGDVVRDYAEYAQHLDVLAVQAHDVEGCVGEHGGFERLLVVFAALGYEHGNEASLRSVRHGVP